MVLDVLVVGAGVAGLTAAALLARSGLQVKLLESEGATGGKVRSEQVGAKLVASGPSVLTMPWVFEELFDACGSSFADRVPYERASLLARHAWSDGTMFDLFADTEASAREVAAIFGAREGDTFRRFMQDAARIYRTVEAPFLRGQKPGIADMVRHGRSVGFGSLLDIDGLRTLWTALGRFREPKLRQLFGRYATYCGASPFEAPATLALVAHVEAAGVLRVEGGIPALGRELTRLAESCGAQIARGTRVERIVRAGDRVSSVIANGVEHRARAILFCGDVSGLSELLPTGETREMRVPLADRSLSAVTFCTVAKPLGVPLVHHNVFFADDYKAEFDEIFEQHRAPACPTVYVCAPERGDAPIEAGEERIFALMNAPATGDDPVAWSEEERRRCKESTIETLARCGVSLDLGSAVMTTPREFHARYPGTGGSLYGPRPNGIFSAFKRRGARSTIPGLYLAGGSVHPGPGVPMAALSGRLAAEALMGDLRSTRASHPAATSGTTSMA